MTAAIELALTPLSLERTDGEIAVVGFFTDERPLRGGAARADWRLCGGLSRRIESGDLSGKSGEALLIGCGRALLAPRLLLLGLGERQRFDRLRVSDGTQQALDRCLKLGCTRVALAPLGIAMDDIPRHADALVAGLRAACRSAKRPMTVHFCVPGREIFAVERALTDARRAANASEITIRVPEVSPDRR
jgi:leucyl aminopeptidase